MTNRRSKRLALPALGETVHDEFLRSLTRERYGESPPRREPNLTETGPTAQWNRHQALLAAAAEVEDEDLWQEEDEDK